MILAPWSAYGAEPVQRLLVSPTDLVRPLGRLPVKSEELTRSISVSPDSSLLAIGTNDGFIFWDIKADKVRARWKNRGIDYSAFSPDGKLLVLDQGSGFHNDHTNSNLMVKEVATGKEVFRPKGNNSAVFNVSFSPDGRFFASLLPHRGYGSEYAVFLWDSKTGRQVRKFTTSGKHVEGYSLSPDGSRIALIKARGGVLDGAVEIQDIDTGKLIHLIKTDRFRRVIYSPDGSLIATSGGVIEVWDAETGKKRVRFKEMGDGISFSPDGRYILGNDSRARYGAAIWNVKTGKIVKRMPTEDYNKQVLFSPDGRLAIFRGYDRIDVWETEGIALAASFQKGEFETKKEHAKRLSLFKTPPREIQFTLKKYDVERGGFSAEVLGHDAFVSVPRTMAKKLSGRKNRLKLVASLRYGGPDLIELAGAVLVDPVSKKRFPVRAVEKRAVAYVAAPSAKKPKPAENIREIPDFNASPRPNDYAIVIGIEKYRGLPKADYSNSDAGLVKDYLKALGIPERNIAYLVNEKASLSDIKKTVERWLPNRVRSGSKVYFYYSGHGAPDPASGDAYLVPYDGDPDYLTVTGYSLKTLYEKLGKLPAESIVMLDSCFSGAGGGKGRSVMAKGARPLVTIKAPTRLKENVVVLAAASGSQISSSSPEKGHGIFTYFMLKALRQGKTELSEIYDYVKPLIEDEAKLRNTEQTPTMTPASDSVRGRFNFR